MVLAVLMQQLAHGVIPLELGLREAINTTVDQGTVPFLDDDMVGSGNDHGH